MEVVAEGKAILGGPNSEISGSDATVISRTGITTS